jgi:protein-L-isoaspartate(D-aspartate) O-methyltransferase
MRRTSAVISAAVLISLAACGAEERDRERMVAEQIEARGVRSASVLSAMRSVPRHLFVPEPLRSFAYWDRPLPIGNGQTISQPYIVALMTELLEVRREHKVLEIGTGSGYQAAVLSMLVNRVFSIELEAELAREARARLQALGYGNVTVRTGDGYAGWPEEAPFDRIILTAAPPEIPQLLIDQLKAGGRLVAPVGSLDQELVVVEKQRNGSVRRRSVLPVRFVPMRKAASDSR